MRDETRGAVLEALQARRSIPRVGEERPPRSVVEQVIAAATWAPNHYHTQPWRFIVVAGDTRAALGDVMAASLAARLEEPTSPESLALVERERRKPLRAPVIVAVAAVPSEMQKVREIEEIAATAAGVQNMLLAAYALGLAAMWRTGAPAHDPSVKLFLGLPERSHILAFVYLGYAAMNPPPRQEAQPDSVTLWMGWE